MAPVPIKRLAALQASRLAELELFSKRLRERERSAFNLSVIESRVQRLIAIWDDARSTHAEIVVRENVANEAYITDNVFAKIQELYEDTNDFVMTIKSELEAANDNVRSERRLSVGSSSNDAYLPAKIPKMDLPTFSGEYEEWENFHDLFTDLVHNSPRLSNSTKLQYLISCLKGDAADWIREIRSTDANYQSTWEALRERFHSPRFIVNKYLGELLDLPYLKKECITEIRSFTDKARRITVALRNLGMPVDNWDVWFIFILAARLPPDARKVWENEMAAADRRAASEAGSSSSSIDPLDKFPKFSEFLAFLERQTHALTIISADHKRSDKSTPSTSKSTPGARKVFHASESQMADSRLKCPSCSGSHKLHKCYAFKAKPSNERRLEVRRLKLCYNCLGNHKVSECKSTYRCSKCGGKHHTLAHDDNRKPPPNSRDANSSAVTQDAKGNIPSNLNVHTASIPAQKYSVILATAQLNLEGPNGTCTRVRALLDQGSETSIVSDSIANLLGLPKTRVNIPLTGLGASAAATARSATRLKIKSLIDPSFCLETEALVLSKLTAQLPSRSALDMDLKMFQGLQLADPQFFVPDSIDVILGADVYGQLVRAGLRNFPSSPLIAQNTALGWIVSGPVQVGGSRRAASRSRDSRQTLHCVTEDDLDETLQRFWALEELPPIMGCSPREDACEGLFRKTHSRTPEGRYVVRLPLKSTVPQVAAETRRIALNSLNYTHRRLNRDPRLSAAYCDFMAEYESLGHMERVPPSELNNPSAWYLPHHAVVQETPEKWKLRVVFDASRQTRDKQCLNSFLEPGPPLQRDLSLTVLNWRQYRYAFTADMVKMFRQIGVAPEDRDFQRILWAPPNSHLRPVDYRLTTVTYGTSPAPYLSLRTLKQLAKDEAPRYPLGVQCLEDHTYIDDTFAGADELSVAVKMRLEFVDLLRSAGIELGKWAANHPNLLPIRDTPSDAGEPKAIDSDESVKALGIRWNPSADEFKFTALDPRTSTGASTKRSVLSSIARLFDPLGWLAPTTVIAKILMQDLWIMKCDWDAPLPTEIQERWSEYCKSLSALHSLSISRWLGTSSGITAQIHGFSDASSRAYAAAVYIRVCEGKGNYRVSLLAAKSKVAPVKTISIPNLELCGAVLLVKLLTHVRKLAFLRNLSVFTWSDSQIVLTWLRKHPCHWKTFVANRTSYIQTEIPSAVWAHVPTKDNPADLATRGCKPLDLIHADLWWHGPAWLALNEEHWPKPAPAPKVMHVQSPPKEEPDLLRRFSSLTRLIRVVAYCRRPLLRWRNRRESGKDLPDFLTSAELIGARAAVIRIAQAHAFALEIKILQEGRPLPKRHPLLSLNPSLNQADGILRVGGRLGNACLPHEQKYPPILPHRSALSRLFIRHAHITCLHGGPTLTSNTVMLQAWILGRNRLAKTEVRNCVTCQRVKPRLAQQMMGILPALRVTPARPFSSSGLDYAGPFQIRASKGRGYKSYKGYIALFVCFSTRAIHLEAVSDLTSSSFLAAYKRFAGRRGICKNLYSDNATTFRAADKELQLMFNAASSFYKSTAGSLSNDGTSWTFIPPNSPHYGGLWEAGVKSVKHHLKRAFGDKLLTFEEFTTVLVEIEACLNSRPLCPLSSEATDLQALTPAHFLLGGASGLVPDEAPPCLPANRLERFHIMQLIRNIFWKRWSHEYLLHLQERGKWRTPSENFAVGQLVLLRDDRYPPSKWPLGRVIETHLGPDDLVRVVTVRTSTSTLKRHVARLCPLNIQDHPKI